MASPTTPIASTIDQTALDAAANAYATNIRDRFVAAAMGNADYPEIQGRKYEGQRDYRQLIYVGDSEAMQGLFKQGQFAAAEYYAKYANTAPNIEEIAAAYDVVFKQNQPTPATLAKLIKTDDGRQMFKDAIAFGRAVTRLYDEYDGHLFSDRDPNAAIKLDYTIENNPQFRMTDDQMLVAEAQKIQRKLEDIRSDFNPDAPAFSEKDLAAIQASHPDPLVKVALDPKALHAAQIAALREEIRATPVSGLTPPAEVADAGAQAAPTAEGAPPAANPPEKTTAAAPPADPAATAPAATVAAPPADPAATVPATTAEVAAAGSYTTRAGDNMGAIAAKNKDLEELRKIAKEALGEKGSSGEVALLVAAALAGKNDLQNIDRIGQNQELKFVSPEEMRAIAEAMKKEGGILADGRVKYGEEIRGKSGKELLNGYTFAAPEAAPATPAAAPDATPPQR